MLVKILFAGSGGQGVLTMGNILGNAAMIEDFHATYLPAYGAAVRGLLRSTDLALGTEEEVRAAAGGLDDTTTAIAAIAGAGPRHLVVKRGERGATVFGADGSVAEAAPFPVTVMNVLGAGDAFASGLLYAWLQGWDLPRAARFGNATGAIIVTRHACANAMPTLAEVETFVAERGGW